MGSTPNFNFPYPDGSEYIDAAAFSGLATAVDTAMNDIEGTQNPLMVVPSLSTGWRAVGGTSGRALRIYRMGRLVQMTGEVNNDPNMGTPNDPVPSNREQVLIIPVGWRPGQRFRTVSVRSSGVMADLSVEADGRVRLSGALIRHSTPGYSLHCSWITDND